MASIRNERSTDAAAVEAVIIAAFRSTPRSSGTEQAIVRALRESGQLVVSLVAEEENHVIGHVAVSPVTITSGASGWYGLGPVSVAPEQQGKGIGTLLITEALSRLPALGAAGCVVLGEPGYYSRFGFISKSGLALPGVAGAFFQAILFSGALPAGQVKYHPAFGATD